LHDPQEFSGTINDEHNYRLFNLEGNCDLGSDISIEKITPEPSVLLSTLFDENYDLLRRDIISEYNSQEHILRESAAIYLGIGKTFSGGGDFQVRASKSYSSVPEPALQRVFLDFDGATGISVHGRPPMDIPPLENSWLATAYPGQVQLIKTKIIETITHDYAPYDVIIYTSDGPLPQEPYASVYFGGGDDRLLGLADNVDQYNENKGQVAIVYVEGFADFEVMGLTVDEMGRMIGNVGSHEFGHLLGLFHTQVPDDIMDTTGTAWDLADEQEFTRAALEASVFPFGYQNSPNLLEQILGRGQEPPPPVQPKCNNGIDDDGDGVIDLNDFSCLGNSLKDDETNPKAQCQDGIDNDADGKKDYPQDPGCANLQDDDETDACFDSDGGLEFFGFGRVIHYTDNLPDYCDTHVNGRLNEVYCKPNGVPEYVSYNCPRGCNNGACIFSPEFIVRNTNGAIVARLRDNGDVYLKGQCTQQSSCLSNKNTIFAYADVLIGGNNKATINGASGDLCIQNGNCNPSPSCVVYSGADFVVRDESGTLKIVIGLNPSKSICYTGTMYQNQGDMQ
jgi:hypothetical protein